MSKPGEVQPGRRHAPDEGASGDEQHERERQLSTDEPPLHSCRSRRARPAARTRLAAQRTTRGHPRHADRGQEAERDRGQRGDSHREQDDATVGREVRRHPIGVGESQQELGRPQRQQEAAGTPEEGEQQTLREQLAQELPAAGAERGSDRHLTLAADSPRHQQARDVRAGDEEHRQRNSGKERERAELAAILRVRAAKLVERDADVLCATPDAPGRWPRPHRSGPPAPACDPHPRPASRSPPTTTCRARVGFPARSSPGWPWRGEPRDRLASGHRRQRSGAASRLRP